MSAYWINTFVEISDEDKLARAPTHTLDDATSLRTTLIEFEEL